ncbi:homeobox-leucine zipper protein ROC8 [Tanacetum coccineum]
MQATSPVVPNRKFNVLRSCTQIDQATWLIAEISHQSIESITFAINQTVGRVKQALEKHQPPSPGDWPTEKQQSELKTLQVKFCKMSYECLN